MSWWQNWLHALAHPADNVVAATVVLVGAVLTVAGSLLVSYFTRRHERQKERQQLIFGPKAEVYIAARSWLRDDMNAAKGSGRHREPVVSDVYKDILAKLVVYGKPEVLRAFEDSVRAHSQFYNLQKTGTADEETVTSGAEEIRRKASHFDAEVRRDMQPQIKTPKRKSITE